MRIGHPLARLFLAKVIDGVWHAFAAASTFSSHSSSPAAKA
jgi:hypothetical protein